MPSRKTLMTLMKTPALMKAFEAYLARKKLSRAWEIARLHRDEKTFYRIYVRTMTKQEEALAPNIRKAGDIAVRKLSKTVLDGFAEQDDWDTLGLDDKRWLVEEQIYAVDYWKKFLKQSKELMLDGFTKLAEGDFRISAEYKKVIYQNADPKRLALELGLENEVNTILGLAVAVGTGDTAAQNRLSRELAPKQKPKKGKMLNPKQLLAYVARKISGVMPSAKPA